MEWPRTKQCYAWIALKEYIPHMGLSWRLDLFPPKGNDTIGTSLRHRWFMAIFLCKGTDSWWLYQESLILRYSGMTFQATFRIFLTKKMGIPENSLGISCYWHPMAVRLHRTRKRHTATTMYRWQWSFKIPFGWNKTSPQKKKGQQALTKPDNFATRQRNVNSFT